VILVSFVEAWAAERIYGILGADAGANLEGGDADGKAEGISGGRDHRDGVEETLVLDVDMENGVH